MASWVLIKVDSRPEKSDFRRDDGRMAMRKMTCGAVVLAFLISGCGGEGDAIPPPQAPPPPPPVAAAPAEPAPPPPAPEPPKPSMLEMQKAGVAAGIAAMNAHDAKKFADAICRRQFS
jgi:hypothetical protein